jgi:hypothetical protein
MSTVKSWRSNVEFDTGVIETTVADMTKQSMWMFIAMLAGGAVGPTNGAKGAIAGSSRWTVDSSSDGSTAGAGDKVGASTGTYDKTKLVRGTNGSSHSWALARCPAAMEAALGFPVYYLVSLSDAGSQNVTAGFMFGTLTPGTTTQDPTATSVSVGPIAVSRPSAAGFNGGTRGHIAISDEGWFCYLQSLTTKNTVPSHIGFYPTQNPRYSDPRPFFTALEWRDSGSGAAGSVGAFGLVNGGNGFIAPNAASAVSLSLTRTWNDHPATAIGCVQVSDAYSAIAMADLEGQFSKDGTFAVLPITVSANASPYSGIKGDAVDLKHCSSQAGFLARFPDAGTMEGLAINHTVFPFDKVFAIG